MPIYEVRVEEIHYSYWVVEADSIEDARERAMLDGKEVYSEFSCCGEWEEPEEVAATWEDYKG